MSDPSTNGALTLRVEDFGPIARAEVDLRPLTVFVGPSNTGKSYLAILIYALHRFFGDLVGHSIPRYLRSFRTFRNPNSVPPSSVVLAALETMTSHMDDSSPYFPTNVILPAQVAHAVRSEINACGTALSNEMIRCFSCDAASSLIRKGMDRANIVLKRSNSDIQQPIEHFFSLTHGEPDLNTTLPEEKPIRIVDRLIASDQLYQIRDWVRELKRGTGYASEDPKFLYSRSLATICQLVVPHIAGPLDLFAYCMPADRAGVMHAHRVVVRTLIQNASRAGLRPSDPIPALSGVWADFLERIIGLEPHRLDGPPQCGSPASISTSIEDVILGGSVRVHRSPLIGYPEFTYRPEGWDHDLPMRNASSMVSELAPVVLYLRYLVHPGDVLIVEEPEAHLHPAMQVKFVRQLAALVHAGVRIIVTTHSEWVMEELANVVHRSDLPRKDDGIHADNGRVALDREQVGAWLFQPEEESGGTVVKEMELDQKVGLYPTDFSAVGAALYNENVDIFNRLAEENGE